MPKFKRSYMINRRSSIWPPRFIMTVLILIGILIAGMVAVRLFYNSNLGPVSKAGDSQTFVVERGATVSEVGDILQEKKLIKNSLVFYFYIRSKGSDNPLIAGTYRLNPSYSTPQIASILSKGAVAS